MKKIILASIFCIGLTTILCARPIAFVDGFHDLGGGCYFFHVSVYEDHDNRDRSDDEYLGGGWIGSGDCYTSGLIENSGNRDAFSSPNETTHPNLKSIDEFPGSKSKELKLNSSQVINVFPNPAKDSITIHFNGYKPTSGFIYSTSGGIVKQFDVAKNVISKNIQINDIAPGAYILMLSNGSDIVKTKVLIGE